MGNNASLNPRFQSLTSCSFHDRPILLDPGCLSCFSGLENTNLNIDSNELQTHNRDLVPKGKVSQTSIAFLQKEEVGFLKACSGKNVSALRYYMNKGVNVNLLDEDRTSPLHVACRSGGLQVVEELLNWGATITIADMAGWTPLHIASFYQRSLICHLLLKKGADPYVINRAGETPWDLVKEKNTEEVFYVHFDRTELKKMGKNKKFEPPGEVCEENILINKLAIRENMFKNRLGIDLRTGGNVIEEEEEKEKEGPAAISSIRKGTDDGLTETRMVTSSNNGASLTRLTARSGILGSSHRGEVEKRAGKKLKRLVRQESLEAKENGMLNKSNINKLDHVSLH